MRKGTGWAALTSRIRITCSVKGGSVRERSDLVKTKRLKLANVWVPLLAALSGLLSWFGRGFAREIFPVGVSFLHPDVVYIAEVSIMADTGGS